MASISQNVVDAREGDGGKASQVGTSASYPSLPIDASAPRKQVRVCIVTPEFVGPTRNGGVGTAYTTLALLLAQAGHEVTVLYTCGDWSDTGTIEHWKNYYLTRGILLVSLTTDPGVRIDTSVFVKRSYQTFQWLTLNEDRFDIVHAPEWQGHLYYSVLAKHQSIAFRNITFCVGTHSPSWWIELGNGRILNNIDQLTEDFLERQSVKMADVVVSPSQYLLGWMKAEGWQLPDHVYVTPYVVPAEICRASLDLDARSRAIKKERVRELVFFGRLEPRKGLVLFCDALDRLAKRLPASDLRITFLGKPWFVDGQEATQYIQGRANGWPFETRILSKDREGALAYLSETRGCLAILPSIMDNFPNTVLECLAQQIPFLASAVGGVPEQISPEDRERVLFWPRANKLAEKLAEVLDNVPKPAAPSFDFAVNNEIHVRWHEQLVPVQRRTESLLARPERPLVSVCLVHFNRPVYLRQALESIRGQDYSPFEVILVDDGSDSPEAQAYLQGLEAEFKERRWQIVRQENHYLGAARNNAAHHANGRFLLFMDDDNYATPSEIRTLVEVAQTTDADILTCVKKLWSGSEAPTDEKDGGWYWPPLGPAIGPGLYLNLFGDANALVKREVFESLGGFKEVYDVTCEDWEFFARATLAGYDLQVVPLPLFWYRVHSSSMLNTTDSIANSLLATGPYLDQVPIGLRSVLLMTLGQYLTTETNPPKPDAGVSPELQAEINSLWESRSWKMFRRLRNIDRIRKGLGREVKPTPQSDREAAQAIVAIRYSISWELTSPLRIVDRILRRGRLKTI